MSPPPVGINGDGAGLVGASTADGALLPSEGQVELGGVGAHALGQSAGQKCHESQGELHVGGGLVTCLYSCYFYEYLLLFKPDQVFDALKSYVSCLYRNTKFRDFLSQHELRCRWGVRERQASSTCCTSQHFSTVLFVLWYGGFR